MNVFVTITLAGALATLDAGRGPRNPVLPVEVHHGPHAWTNEPLVRVKAPPGVERVKATICGTRRASREVHVGSIPVLSTGWTGWF